MTSQPDFWGDIELTGDRTPLVILREQAALLGAKTKNVVKVKVTTSVSGKHLHHSFNLVAPALDNYTYELFRVRHGVEAYPVNVEAMDAKLPIKAHFPILRDEAGFAAWLQEQLSSPRTKKIIATLFSQVAA